MHKQFNKAKKPPNQSDKDTRNSRIAYSKVKNKYLINDLSLNDWETENELIQNKMETAQRADIS